MAEPSNPNGANQFQMDPRQKMCWESYIDPRSETFGNARQSAIRAGYEEEYAGQITVTEWFIVKVRRLNMLNKAEKVLDRTLDFDPMNGGDKVDAGLVRAQTDVAKFVASTQGKDDGYSSRVEIKTVDDAEFALILEKYATRQQEENSSPEENI